ncbi:MAG: Gfo/Idh/MocA family oxidoreductase, partial [Gammaproteobacteria bacterium]|nr:Gfo/Idh/MocA family oxidoreductase [Gammaproteobacteria bacterium]
MHKKVSIAVLGCGKIAHNHLQAIIDNQKDFNLVSVCDNNSSLAEQAGEKYNIPFFSDLEIMLKTIADIEIVSICTPSGLHAQQSILISQYGKHVITEKPMACEISDARTMIDAAQKNQKKLFVVKQNRLSPTIQALKKAIDGEDFGKIYLVHSNIFWMRPQAYYDQASWRGTRRYDGGALMNQASHYVDLLEYLLGPVDSVQAMTRTLGRKIETEDTAVVNLSWKN